MNSQTPTVRAIVYGTIDILDDGLDDSLVFIPQDRANELAVINEVLRSASTWGEVRARMPASAYETLLKMTSFGRRIDFEEFCQDERRTRPDLTHEEARGEYLALSPDERHPETGDPFEAGNIGAICDGDFPPWPQQEMLSWVPTEIQQQYGRRGTSMITGESLEFRAEDEHALVEALTSQGFQCVRDDILVGRACGY